MAATTLESLIAKEHETVQKEREDLLAQRVAIDEKLDALELRLRAAANYRATLEGKFTPPTRAPSEPRTRKSSGVRAPRGSREQFKIQILDLLKQHPEGLVSNQIADALPDSAKQLPNVLSLLKSEGHIKQDARRGPYYLPSEAA